VPHGAAGFFFSNEGGGWEFPAFWAVTLVVQALLGDGAYAPAAGLTVNHHLTAAGRRNRSRQDPQSPN
jgi:hypothetical protein